MHIYLIYERSGNYFLKKLHDWTAARWSDNKAGIAGVELSARTSFADALTEAESVMLNGSMLVTSCEGEGDANGGGTEGYGEFTFTTPDTLTRTADAPRTVV